MSDETVTAETEESVTDETSVESTGTAVEEIAAGSEAATDTTPLVYVGPSIKALTLSRHQAFAKGKLPAKLQEACDGNAQFARLFVKVTRLAAVKKELAKSSSRYAKAYAAVAKQVKENGNVL